MRAIGRWRGAFTRAAGGRGLLPLALLLAATLSCALPGATPTATPSPTATTVFIASGGSSPTPPTVSPTPSATFTPSPSPSPSPTATFTPSPSPTPSPTPTDTPLLPSPGPYVVKQTETLGGEVISGIVCRRTQPFTVNSVTPKVSFNFIFVPLDADHGKVTYQYSIPSAGETHDAKGTYTIGAPHKDGAVTLSLAVSDHVVFKGFDGNIPNRYKFDLVPVATAPCP